MKVLDWYKGNKKMRIEEVEIVISKIVEMSYINGSREIRKELEAYVRTSEGFLFFLSKFITYSRPWFWERVGERNQRCL